LQESSPTPLEVLTFQHVKIVKQDSLASLVHCVKIVKQDSSPALQVNCVKIVKQDSPASPEARAMIALLERIPVQARLVLIALVERPAQKVAPTVTPAQVVDI